MRRTAAQHVVEAELVPGVVVGHRYVLVGSVGADLPAGRFPLTASASMSVGVAEVAGVDRPVVVGGVQALASTAFGLLDEPAVDLLVGAGNACVAEAERQLSGTVSIDLLAGPSEIAVIADASPRLGRRTAPSPAAGGARSPPPTRAWPGRTTPSTAGGAKHSAGLSVSRFLEPLTFQRVARQATPALADAVEVISASEGTTAHQATAALRTRRWADSRDAELSSSVPGRP